MISTVCWSKSESQSWHSLSIEPNEFSIFGVLSGRSEGYIRLDKVVVYVLSISGVAAKLRWCSGRIACFSVLAGCRFIPSECYNNLDHVAMIMKSEACLKS
jgi:hypothetical protein